MSEEVKIVDWSVEEKEPEIRGKVTKKEKPKVETVASSDDPLKTGVTMLVSAAKAAHQTPQEERIEEVRRSLKPYVLEAEALHKAIEERWSKFGRRLEELVGAARSRDLRRYRGIDDALTHLDRIATETIRTMASALRVLPDVPKRVRDLTWTEVQTQKWRDIQRDVVAFRDTPKGIDGTVAAAEGLLVKIEEVVEKSQPTRQFIDADMTQDNRPKRQIKADNSSYDPFASAGR
jgi:hypothetical protein